MTVSSQVSSVSYLGDGVTTLLPVPYYFLEQTHLLVTRVNADTSTTTLVLGSDYSVSGAGNQSGGSITMFVAPAVGVQILIDRSVPATQETDYVANDPFPAESHERALDKLTMLVQQNNAGLARALLRPIGKNYYDAQGRQIKDLADPTDAQDATTQNWVSSYVLNLLASVYGPITSAVNVVRGVVSVLSVADLLTVGTRTDLGYLVRGYYGGSIFGGGAFIWDPSTAKAQHDGCLIISPTVPWNGSQLTISNFLSGVGETDPSGSGCFRRICTSVSPMDAGAVGDDLADDSASIVRVITGNLPITWGSRTYRFITPIIKTLTAEICWSSEGATLHYDGALVQNCIYLTLTGVFEHTLDGGLTVDTGDKSHTGWFIESSATGDAEVSPSMYLNGLRAVNVLRHTLALGFGDGIRIAGGFYRLKMENTYVKKVRAAAGAIGTVGVFGITVTRTASGEPKYLDIDGFHVEDVQSNDPAYRFDQDGIRIFSSITGATEAVHNVRNGTIKNTRNRSVKHQGMQGTIENIRILKQASVVDPGGFGVSPSDWDVEAQYSGVTIRDVTFRYEGFGSRGVVRYIANPEPSRVAGNGVVSGIRGEILSTSITGIVGLTDDISQGAMASDISVVGQSSYIVSHQALGSNAVLSLSNIFGQPTIAGVQEVGVPLGYVQAVNVANTGAADVPLMLAPSSNNQRQLRSVNCQGFSDIPYTSSIGGMIADAGILQLAPSGVGSGGGLALVSCGYDRASVATIAFDSAGAAVLSQVGSRFVAGNTTEPATGDFRVYVSAGKLTIRNRFGAPRRMTVQIIG